MTMMLRTWREGKEIVSRRTVDEGQSWSEATTVVRLPGGHIEA